MALGSEWLKAITLSSPQLSDDLPGCVASAADLSVLIGLKGDDPGRNTFRESDQGHEVYRRKLRTIGRKGAMRERRLAR